MNIRAHIEVNLDMIEYNLNQMHQAMGENSKFMAVVKADAYGHGAIPIAKRLALNEHVMGFATATFEEALELRESSITKEILILGYTFPYCYEDLVLHDITPTIYTLETAQLLQEAAQKAKKICKVHIKIDTGMGRIGMTPDDTGLKLIQEINKLEHVEIEGIFTHFAKADEVDKTHAYQQMQTFLSFVHMLKKVYHIKPRYIHAANSASIISLKPEAFSFSRAGIAMYGICPDDAMRPLEVKLEPVLSMYTRIVHLKDVFAGQTISYGGTYEVKEHRKIATISIGYGDGFPRSLSNKGYVLIRGQRAPIVGRICMDQCMVDVTDIVGVCHEDLVTLIGRDGDEYITVEMLSAWSGVFHYELICNLNKRVKRLAF